MKHYKQMGSFKNVRKLFAPVNLHIQMDLILELQNWGQKLIFCYAKKQMLLQVPSFSGPMLHSTICY